MNFNNTDDLNRIGQAYWFGFWPKFWKLTPYWPPYPPNDNLTPLWGKFFSAELFKTFLHFRLSLDLVTTSPVEKTPYISFWGPPGGGKGGSGGQKTFFGSKCLKLPNSSRKVVKLRSKNFQCIYLINTYEIFKKILKILDLQIWDIRGFFAWKTFEIPQLMEKNSSDKS